MTEAILLRWSCLLVPALVVGTGWMLRRHGRSRRRAGATLLGFLAAFVALGLTNQLALLAGWWSFAPAPGTFRGVPLDLWIGWALLWGAIPALLPDRLPVWVVVLVGGWLDLLLMPRLDGIVQLGPHWLYGEVLALVLTLVPTALLVRWTVNRRHLTARVLLQLLTFTGLVLWLLPSAVMARGDGSWSDLFDGPVWWITVLAQLMALAAVPALAAVVELAVRGHGTPYPWDPPDRLVTTGPYAYFANPMQCSVVVMLGLLALGTGSWSLAAATVGAVAFSVAVADPHERRELAAREGDAWRRYDEQVHPWRIRSSPYAGPPAELYLSETCPICAQTRTLIRSTRPRDLTFLAAETYPGDGTVAGLRRALYVGPDGLRADGLGAVARAAGHSGPGWAYAGWLVGLPVVRPVLQLLLDGMGGGERRIPARPPER